MKRALTSMAILIIAAIPGYATENAASANAEAKHVPPQPGLTGTLFFSPAERAKLDKARRTGGARDPESPAQAPLVINGVVKRGDGTTSVWIDGSLIDPVGDPLATRVSASTVGHPDGLRLASSERLTVLEKSPNKPGRAKTKRQPSGPRRK